MYGTKLKDDKYLVVCFAVGRQVKVINFIVDTGAMFTCCNYKFFDTNMAEKDLRENEIELLSEFVKGAPLKFYKLSLRQFTTGNMDLGKQNIWITFDERVTDNMLGMDIPKKVIFTANPFNQKIYFCKDRDDYNNNFELLKELYQLNNKNK